MLVTMKNIRKKTGIKELIKQHVISNKKEYIIMLLLFIIGIFLGVLFINNVQDEQFNNISSYINNFVEKLKATDNLDSISILKGSLIKNAILAVGLWFFGTTVIGIPVVFGLVAYRGFCLGYTISACVCVLGTGKGLALILSNLLLQNFIFIPAILAISVSGFKLYKSIIKDKRRENIKLEIVRHTVFCCIMCLCLAMSSVIEVFVSNNLFKIIVGYF